MKYKDAGVDIDREGEFIKKLLSQLKFKRGISLNIGKHFTGIVEFGDYYIAINTDGVGSKVLIANEMKKWDTIGIDCIAMNVNDTICIGAEPIAFVDYLAIDHYDMNMAEQIGKGLNKGAELANVEIIGGETATLPEIINGIDLSGTSIGIIKKEDIITGDKIKKGDLIFGIPSSGVHSNGLTLARKVLKMDDEFEGHKIGEELLKPTRIYVKEILSLLKSCKPHGLAHITGGGLKNILRLKRMRYIIEEPLNPQKIFELIMNAAKIDYEEMYKTFNMGMGFAIIASEDCEKEIKNEIRDAKVVGYVDEGSEVTIPELDVRYTSY